MAVYQRFQTLSAARQELFLPESPVWVSRFRLSRDLESGKRLLQVRMVNCSERTVRQVFLRVRCFGADGAPLGTLELLPMERLSARPGAIFGEDRPVELTRKGTAFTEVYAQRVCFADGSAWDEPEPARYLAFQAKPVRPEDPHYELLADRARSGGVRNNCYFKAGQGLWVCTCGMPNALRSLRCVRCGARRVWLEEHMDPNLLDAPTPEKAPAPAPAPAPVFYPQPAPTVTVVPTPIRTEPPVRPTIVVQPAPEPEGQEAPPSHGGRNAAIVAALLLVLALGAFGSWRYLLPWLRYREAARERSAGSYDRAASLFEALGDYKDSPEQLRQTLVRKGTQLMNQGKYQEAMELFESLGDQEERVADCLYALGVLAYNADDPETALEYTDRLRARFPDYEKTGELIQYCHYDLGCGLSEQAAGAEDPAARLELYGQAREHFTLTDGYEDSELRIRECDYRIALAHRDLGQLDQAIAKLEELGDYRDARELRLELMYEFVTDNAESYLYSAVLPVYLTELVQQDYPGAQDLYDRVNGLGCQFQLELADAAPGDAFPAQVYDLSRVFIRYQVEVSDEEGPVLVLVRYELPDGREGRGLLNADRSASGEIGWAQIPFPTDCRQEGEVKLYFFDAKLGEDRTMPFQELSFRYADPANDTPDPDGGPTDPTGEPGDSSDGAPVYGG